MQRNKAGILTTYFASNFGAMLQPFALKRFLQMAGLDVEVIRYEQKTTYRFYNPWKLWILKTLNIRRILSYLVSLPGLLKRDRTFNHFMWRFINPEKWFCKSIPEDKDFYFVGSDQVWAYKAPEGFDKVYFGNFSTKSGARKIAYAVSAEALEFNDEQVIFLKNNIYNFNRVSVREKELEENLKSITGRKDIVTVLDPTMLVDPIVFSEIKHINPCQDNSFVFFYCIRDCYDFTEMIHNYAESIGAKMVVVSEMPSSLFKKYGSKHNDVLYFPYAGIELFLGGIQYSECVFTPSFHGSVFSILYHKRFYTLDLEDNKMTRPKHLLRTLGLSNHLLKRNSTIENLETNWNEVDSLLNEQRDISRAFVFDCLA